MSQCILLEKQDQVATITLNRPESGNAFALESYLEIKQAFEELGRDDDVRVIVVTGAGKHFSAGGDINRFKNNIESGTYIRPENVVHAGAMSDAALRCPKPIVAMINGAAMGAGCSLALACDFRVAAPSSKLGMAFINMGFSGDTGAIYLLSTILGTARTKELMALGKPLSGEEALRYGLVTRLAEEGNLEETTLALVQELLSKPTGAIGCQKRLQYEFFYRDFLQFNLREADYMSQCSRTKDHAEAVYAFLEKRKPQFIGR